MPQPVLINGVSYGFANIKMIIGGVPVVGITKLSYNAKQNKENLYGASYEPISRGYGNVEYEASMEIYTEEWQRIIASSPDRNPLLIPAFDVPVVFGGIGVTPMQHTLKAVEFMENPLDSSQGDTSIKITIPLIIAGIIK
jgi:hypothetical protein